MKTSKQWVKEVEQSSEKLIQWLQRQYVGESLASERLVEFANNPDLNETQWKIIKRIALDEFTHSKWIAQLLVNRNIQLPEVSYTDDRYWKEIGLDGLTNDELFAAGAHAEEMRLERIEAIVKSKLDDDIKETFKMILKDERFHAKAFKKLASDEAYNKLSESHERGMQALNLVI